MNGTDFDHLSYEILFFNLGVGTVSGLPIIHLKGDYFI